MINKFFAEIGGINLIDIGSSGNLDEKWKPLNRYLNVIGFDPNADECRRMETLPHDFLSVKYLPYAIAGESKESTLYITTSHFCYSLLKPNTEWLDRFAFGDLFAIEGQQQLKTVVLNEIEEVRAMNVDALKMDTQGLELPILKQASKVLADAFFIETETGFVENYIGETTFAQVSEFMSNQNFLLFDVDTSHRIARNNIFKNNSTNAEQLMWCEAVWLKDYIQLAKHNKLSTENFGREKILKALILCALQGCIDYGYEIATLGYEFNHITQNELTSLQTVSSWEIGLPKKIEVPLSNKFLNYALRLLPATMRKQIAEEARIASRQKHILK